MLKLWINRTLVMHVFLHPVLPHALRAYVSFSCRLKVAKNRCWLNCKKFTEPSVLLKQLPVRLLLNLIVNRSRESFLNRRQIIHNRTFIKRPYQRKCPLIGVGPLSRSSSGIRMKLSRNVNVYKWKHAWRLVLHILKTISVFWCSKVTVTNCLVNMEEAQHIDI